MRTILSTSLVIAALSSTALANTWHVSPTGNDAASGSSTDPWKTIQRASNTAAAGDTVLVHAGTYTGFT
ncbi:MAG TPA: DUF1565 domain-containing protein, partial [Kofleriaceae bacterium]|nr:DUF1565 domain-containing protein [Kofleriaceae bacterium]